MNPIVKVISARYINQYRLSIEFSDGAIKEVDFEPFLIATNVDWVQQYLDFDNFKSFYIENGNLVWGEDWDLIFPIDQLYNGRITLINNSDAVNASHG